MKKIKKKYQNLLKKLITIIKKMIINPKSFSLLLIASFTGRNLGVAKIIGRKLFTDLKNYKLLTKKTKGNSI